MIDGYKHDEMVLDHAHKEIRRITNPSLLDVFSPSELKTLIKFIREHLCDPWKFWKSAKLTIDVKMRNKQYIRTIVCHKCGSQLEMVGVKPQNNV